MDHATDDELFARVFERVHPRLRGLLKRYGVALEDREDVLQEAVLALWRKRIEVRNYEAWLLSALRMECLRYRWRVGRQVVSALDEAALERLACQNGLSGADAGLHHDLRRLIRRLPARHQALIYLRYWLGLTSEETASRLGYRQSSLKKTTTRCLQVLQRQLGRGPTR